MKKLLILLAILLGLGAFVYFYEIQGDESREESRRLEESLLQVKQDRIQGFAIHKPDQPAIRLRKEGENWMIQEPLETSADQTSVNSFLSSLETARRVRTFEEVTPEKLPEYGLDSPRLTLTVDTGEGQKEILVGSEDFSKSSVYVRFADSPAVHLTDSSLVRSAERDLFEWRNKEVLEFDRDKVKVVEIRQGESLIRLRKEGEDWMLEAPIQERADAGSVSSLLSTFDMAQAQSFVAEQAADLAGYGLARPSLSLRVQQEGEDSWRTLELGRLEGEAYLARNPNRPMVFTVRQNLYDELTRDLWNFREKRVVGVDQSRIALFSIRRGAEEIVIRHENVNWTVDQPEPFKDREALSYKFWYPVQDIEFQAINGPGEFPQADVEVVITLQDGSLKTYRFARQEDRAWALQVEDRRQGPISVEDFEKLQFKLEDILAAAEEDS